MTIAAFVNARLGSHAVVVPSRSSSARNAAHGSGTGVERSAGMATGARGDRRSTGLRSSASAKALSSTRPSARADSACSKRRDYRLLGAEGWRAGTSPAAWSSILPTHRAVIAAGTSDLSTARFGDKDDSRTSGSRAASTARLHRSRQGRLPRGLQQFSTRAGFTETSWCSANAVSRSSPTSNPRIDARPRITGAH